MSETDNNNYSYNERQSNVNIGEQLFETYMNEKKIEFYRMGFDEKNNNIKGFYLMHPVLRSLPDYISYNSSKNKMYYIQVKGTNKIKVDDFLNYSQFCLKEHAIPFKNQNYAELKAQHDENNLFEDPEFPANDSSLYYSQNKPYGVQWLRPKVFLVLFYKKVRFTNSLNSRSVALSVFLL